jgi:death-on-curing protein
VTVEYLDLADFIAIAAEVTGLDVETVMKVADLDLADSALHAPAAGFSDTDFYPDFIAKAAVLVVRLAANPGTISGTIRNDPSRPTATPVPRRRPLTRTFAITRGSLGREPHLHEFRFNRARRSFENVN